MGYREFLTEIAEEYGTKYTNIEMIVIYPLKGQSELKFKSPIPDENDVNRAITGVFIEWRR